MEDHLKQVREDVDRMSRAFDTPEGAEGTEAPGTESASTEAPKTVVPGTEAPGTDAPKTEAPGTDAPKTEAPETEAPTTEAPVEDESERLRRDNESLRDKLNKMTEPKEKPGTSAPTTEAPVEAIDFLKDLDLDELTRSPEEFNKLLNAVSSRGLGAFEKTMIEKILRAIPDIVKTNILTVNSLKEASEQFYEANKDLVPFKAVVAATYEEVASEDPGKSPSEYFKDVAEKARERLELYKEAVKEDDKDKHPKLPHRKRQQRQVIQKPNTTPIEDEIDKMNASLDL